MPIGCNDDDMPWEREGDPLHTKYFSAINLCDKASKKMFDMAGVKYRQFVPKGQTIEVDL